MRRMRVFASSGGGLRGSRVVHDQGRPLVGYYGTQEDFSQFSKAMVKSNYPYSIGLHFTNQADEAGIYADSSANLSSSLGPTVSFLISWLRLRDRGAGHYIWATLAFGSITGFSILPGRCGGPEHCRGRRMGLRRVASTWPHIAAPAGQYNREPSASPHALPGRWFCPATGSGRPTGPPNKSCRSALACRSFSAQGQ